MIDEIRVQHEHDLVVEILHLIQLLQHEVVVDDEVELLHWVVEVDEVDVEIQQILLVEQEQHHQYNDYRINRSKKRNRDMNQIRKPNIRCCKTK